MVLWAMCILYVEGCGAVVALQVFCACQPSCGLSLMQEHVASAVEIEERGRLLLHHFQSHGTPVMIGGDTYAYTILGINCNPSTGDMLLLILDPHYVGNDDPCSIIRDKGCSWQRVRKFFQSNFFYNMCLPRVPQGV